MRVFITGASGWIGSAVTAELLRHDHKVTGLARNDAAAAALETAGARPHRGDLDDPDSLVRGAEDADAVIHLAFKHDFADFASAGRTEHAAVSRMLEALRGTDRTFMLASGLGALAGGRLATEEDPSPFHGVDSMRGGSENLALEYADRGVRAVALRFAASVHGRGDHGFVAVLAQIARERGVSGYIGEGTTRWPAVARADAATMVRLALEKAPASARLHAVAEEGIATRDIATALGRALGVPTVSVAPDEAEAHFGWMARFFGLDLAGSSKLTRDLLGWRPTEPGLLEDIADGYYTP